MRRLAPRAIRAAYGVLLLLVSVRVVQTERLPTTTYTPADGLAHRVIRKIVADSRGFVWFCTRRGLSRFDGQRFLTYGVSDGLPMPSVNHVLETSKGAYWVATNGGGVCRLNTGPSSESGRGRGSRFTKCARGETHEASQVNVLYEDRAGRLWAGTDGGLFRLLEAEQEAKLERVELGLHARPDRAVQIWAFAEDPAGSLWIATSWGLVRRISEDRTMHYRIEPVRGSDHVFALLADRENRMWIGHDTGLIVFRYDEPASTPFDSRPQQLPLEPRSSARSTELPRTPGRAVRFTRADGLSGDRVLELHQSRTGELWIATSNGLTRFDGGRFTAYRSADGIAMASALAEDRDGHIWIAAPDGALKLARTGFVRYGSADGLDDDVIVSVFENTAGELTVVTRTQHVHRFDGTRFTSTRPNLSKDGQETYGVAPALQARAGEWWVPGTAGLYRFPRVDTLEDLARVRASAVYTARDGLAGGDLFRLFEDSRGDLWIGRRAPTRTVLTRWERATGTFHQYSDSDGLPPFSRPLAFEEDGTGSVWVGFWAGGLARYRNGRFTLFTTADGVPRGGIFWVYADTRRRLWIGTSGGGLGRIDDLDVDRPRVVRYTTAQGLASDSIHSITEDHSGRIYLGTFSGIDRLDPATGRVRHFPLPDGLAGTEVDLAFCDRRGTLWFGTSRGLASLVQAPDQPGTPPAMLIGGVRISGEAHAISELGQADVGGLDLRSNQNQVQIDFFSISQTSPVRYQYKLENADRDWGEPTEQRTVNYASLSPGRYRFVVRAIAADGLVSPTPASVTFHISPPIWLRWWFLTGAAALLVFAAYALHRVRLVRLLELERVRMRIATDLHDDIGSSLTQIAILSEVAERRMMKPDPGVAEPISRVSLISRELVDSMSEIVWAINPRNDRLRDLAARMRRFGADMLTSRQIGFRFRSPDDVQDVPIEADLRRQAFLIFKEAIHNAVRHSRCTEVDVEIGVQHRHLTLRVTDNGIGFDARLCSEGHGVPSMQARARGMGGRLEIVSEPAGGTTVRFEVSLARRAGGARKAS